jgi:hypothetical protein
MVRREGKRPISTLWIFCEGETEQNYFFKLKQDERIKMQVKLSPNKDAPGIIEHAISYRKSNSKDFEKGDFIYCIFDRDKNQTDKRGRDQIELAKNLAKANNIKIIFSNPSFEYWILCHFESNLNQIDQENLERKLDMYMNAYNKADKDIYGKIKHIRQNALINARKSVAHHTVSDILCRDCNPVTNMFEIIDLLDMFR